MRSSAFHFGKVCGKQVYPPPPHTSESLDWRGFCKNALQNLEPQRFRDRNLDCKSLSGIPVAVLSAACALEMIYFFSGARKVRCHIVPVDNSYEHESIREGKSGGQATPENRPVLADGL
jgi:hypothetical protein